MELKDEVDKAVDDLFGRYKVKPTELAQAKNEIPFVQEQQQQTPTLEKADIEQIKELTAMLLRRLSLAAKAESWWHRLYYSQQFLQIAMAITKLVTKRKSA